jgi:chromosomal replication initiator protein
MFSLVKDFCRRQMPESPYNLWIRDLECEHIDHTSAVIVTEKDLFKTILETRYLDMLAQAFEEVMGFPVEVTIKSREAERRAQEIENPVLPEEDELSSNGLPGGEYAYTFSTFIVGASNNFAHAASQAVAAHPASAYNPLYIYGDSGLGKTHLLCAICDEISRNFPDYKVIYIKGEDFTNELIDAIGKKTTNEFHNKYRQADILLVDDIQFISGKESTQEEFFHTFNALYESGKQIVLTSDRPPKEIKTLEDRLRTRFEMGLIADVQPPEYETRVAIVRRKAELLGIDLPDDVVNYIANRLKTNIRQLEGTVKKIKAYKLLANISPSVAIAQSAIRDILNDSQPVSVTVDHIINEVARYYEVSPQDIRSNRRTQNVSLARQVAMYVVREITQMSMEAIGEEFGGRDHSTVVYALKQVKQMMDESAHMKNTVDDLIKNLSSQ